jgi:fluoride exporter
VRAGALRFFRVAMGLLLLRAHGVSCGAAARRRIVPRVTVVGIAVAGSLGALARYGLDGAVSRRWPGAFPWGTFVVNISGAFLLGLLFVLLTERVTVDPWIRSSLTIGFLGAYTTFSTLSFESYRLLEDGAVGLALANALGSVAAGLVAVYLGVVAGRAI